MDPTLESIMEKEEQVYIQNFLCFPQCRLLYESQM